MFITTEENTTGSRARGSNRECFTPSRQRERFEEVPTPCLPVNVQLCHLLYGVAECQQVRPDSIAAGNGNVDMSTAICQTQITGPISGDLFGWKFYFDVVTTTNLSNVTRV